MTQIDVKAADGVRVPCEDNPRRYITDSQAVSVALTAYYQRQIQAGDLLIVSTEHDSQSESAVATPSAKTDRKVKQETDRGES